MTADKPLLRVEHLRKTFGGVVVLDDISATVAAGSMTCFVGPNAAGKTSLFHVISGNLRPDSGEVWFGDRQITGLSPWRIARMGVGKLFQDVRLFGHLSVLENVTLAATTPRDRTAAAALWPWRAADPPRPDRPSPSETLELLGVQPPYDRPADQLSFGNKRLLGLARLLCGGFNLLLLDEPAAGLHAKTAERLGEKLSSLARSLGLTLAVIEHDRAFISRFATDVYLLRGGRVHDRGTPAELFARRDNRDLLVGL